MIERPPRFFAGVLIEGDDTCGRLCADLKYQQLVFNQRRSGDARELFDSVFLRQVLFPQHYTLGGIETEEVPQREQPAVPNNGCGAGPARVRIEGPFGVIHAILVSPKEFATRFIKTEHALFCCGRC